MSYLREGVEFGTVGLFWGCGHRIHGVDLLGGEIKYVDWAAGDCRIYGREWDLAQLVYFGGVGIVCAALIFWVGD